MKYIKFFVVLTLLTQSLVAQKTVNNKLVAIDKKALLLPDSLTKTTEGISGYIRANFITEREKTRAAFIWVATNIRYDVENMFAINFYEKKEDKILKPLKSRKGICENYAALFNDICLKIGIKSFVIEGYTRQNGFTEYIPHAWCAAMVDSVWSLFDPTWAAGYIDNGRFHPQINNVYYNVNPTVLIKSHIPFDYLWQFLNYPVTNQEFYEGKTQLNKFKPYFNYIDSIKIYENQTPIDQLISSAYRIEKNGIKNSLIFDRLQHIKLQIENDKQNKTINTYNDAVNDYNTGINCFNDFVNYRNKQFTPAKTDAEIQAMLDIVDSKFKSAKIKLSIIKNPDTNTSNMISQLTKSVDDATTRLIEQQDWLKTYFSKGKLGRKSSFYVRIR